MATEVQDYRLEIDKKSFKAESYFPGITYDDYDRAGGISPWKICRMFEAGRMVPFFQGNFLDFNNLRTGNFTIFVLGGDYYFDPCLWEVARKYHYFPYKISVELINLGQTSLTVRQVLTNLLDQKEIATFYGKLVYVDRNTKRSQVLPNWHRLKYQSVESQDRVRLETSMPRIPDNAFSAKTVVGASDTDHNGHTNQGSYIRFCLDAAELARRAQQLHCLINDICLYPVIKMTTAYRGETLAGDELTTSVWEDNLTPRILHFVIMRGRTLVFVSTITFKDRPCSKL
uniref:Uncharacterized protein n=1 Tax=Arion vulgaris TaxID=1028688 RepID=A0A0B6ZJ21_9EUPU